VIFDSNSQFQEVKKSGVGRDTILKFLGGNWEAWMIQEALRFIDDYKTYLDKELARYDEWSTSDKFIRCLFPNKTAFNEVKNG